MPGFFFPDKVVNFRLAEMSDWHVWLLPIKLSGVVLFIAYRNPTTQILNNLVGSSSLFKPMFFLQKHTQSGRHHPPTILT